MHSPPIFLASISSVLYAVFKVRLGKVTVLRRIGDYGYITASL